MGELIIGDRQTGKTAVATDTILNQKGKDVLCLCSNWSKSSNSSTNCKYIGRSWFNGLQIIVAANADAPATLQYLAPYTGATWLNISCTMVSIRLLFTMIYQSKRKHTVRCHFFFVDHQVVKHTLVMFSTYTHVY